MAYMLSISKQWFERILAIQWIQLLPVWVPLMRAWRHPDVNGLTFVSIITHKETDFKKPTKVLGKHFRGEKRAFDTKDSKKQHKLASRNKKLTR